MPEANIKVHDVTKGDKTYKNIYPKKELDVKDYIIVEKLYPDTIGRQGQFGLSFNMSVKYKDDIVSFFLTEKEYMEFQKAAPEVGDKVRMTYDLKVAKFQKDGKLQERKYPGLVFTSEE